MQARLLRPMWPGAAADDQVWLLPDPCPLHDGRLCTVYEHRPQVCRDFPQAVGANPVARLQIWVEYARICPITFNVIEQLGAEE
jgi:Fe-S-cluster containining protein